MQTIFSWYNEYFLWLVSVFNTEIEMFACVFFQNDVKLVKLLLNYDYTEKKEEGDERPGLKKKLSRRVFAITAPEEDEDVDDDDANDDDDFGEGNEEEEYMDEEENMDDDFGEDHSMYYKDLLTCILGLATWFDKTLNGENMNEINIFFLKTATVHC